METNNSVQFSNVVSDQTQFRTLAMPGKSSIQFPVQITNSKCTTAMIVTLHYSISKIVSYINVKLDSPHSDGMSFSIPARDTVKVTGLCEVAIPNYMYDINTSSLTLELDHQSPNGGSLRLQNVLMRMDPCESTHNYIQSANICQRCDTSYIVGTPPDVPCMYCVINENKSKADHCHHICTDRAYTIANGNVCDDCKLDWLQCYLCLDDNHCVHQCELAGKLDVCDERLCQKYLHACYLCGSKDHCLHKCDIMCNTCVTEGKACEECGSIRHCLHCVKCKVDVCHECMDDNWETCALCGDASHCHHEITKEYDNAIQCKYGWLKLEFLMLGLPLFLSDVGSNLALAVRYFILLDFLWGGLTLAFVIFPSICMGVYSYAHKKSLGSLAFTLKPLTIKSILADLLLFLQITPVLWMIKLVICWWDLHSSDPENIIKYWAEERRPDVRQSEIENVRSGKEQTSIANEYMRSEAETKQSEMQNIDLLDLDHMLDLDHIEVLRENSKATINHSNLHLMNSYSTINNNYASEKTIQYSCRDHLIRDMKTKTDIYDQVNSMLYNTQLFEAFMGNTLQTVLQLYILACNGFVASSWLQWWSVWSSLMSVSWITVNHYCSQHPNEYIRFFKVKLGILLPRYIFTIASRVLAMALFASVYHWWLFVFAGGHTIIVFLYTVFVLSSIKLGVCTWQTYKCLGNCLLVSFMSLFCFNPRSIVTHDTDNSGQPQRVTNSTQNNTRGHYVGLGLTLTQKNTRGHYVVHYAVLLVLNVLLILLWWIDIPSQSVQHTDYNSISPNLTYCNCTHVKVISNQNTRIVYNISMMFTIIITWAFSVGFTCLYYAWFHHSANPVRRYNNRSKSNLLREIKVSLQNRRLDTWQTFEEAHGMLTIRLTFKPKLQESKDSQLKRVGSFITNKLSSLIRGNDRGRERENNGNVYLHMDTGT